MVNISFFMNRTLSDYVFYVLEIEEVDKLMVGWFLCFIAYQLFLGYLIPKPFS